MNEILQKLKQGEIPIRWDLKKGGDHMYNTKPPTLSWMEEKIKKTPQSIKKTPTSSQDAVYIHFCPKRRGTTDINMIFYILFFFFFHILRTSTVLIYHDSMHTAIIAVQFTTLFFLSFFLYNKVGEFEMGCDPLLLFSITLWFFTLLFSTMFFYFQFRWRLNERVVEIWLAWCMQ